QLILEECIQRYTHDVVRFGNSTAVAGEFRVSDQAVADGGGISLPERRPILPGEHAVLDRGALGVSYQPAKDHTTVQVKAGGPKHVDGAGGRGRHPVEYAPGEMPLAAVSVHLRMENALHELGGSRAGLLHAEPHDLLEHATVEFHAHHVLVARTRA